MRCSICDAPKTKWIFHNWHCNKCAEVITDTIGQMNEDDNFTELSLETLHDYLENAEKDEDVA